MTASSRDKKIYLFGDSIIENSNYVGDGDDVMTCLSELWQNEVLCVAWDGGIMADIETQFNWAIENGFDVQRDIAIVSVIGNDLLGKIDFLEAKTTSIANALIHIHNTIAPLYEEYSKTIGWMKAQGIKNLALVTIYPLHEFTNYGIPNKYIGQETLTWVLMTPVLALINKHIRTTANAFSAQIVDLFHGQLDSSDIVYNIEPGKTASPKIAALMAEVASTFVNQ